MTIQMRADRIAFKISGAEATRLLHDVLTPPVEADPNGVRWFALLSPQGKIAAEGLIGWANDAYWLDVAAQAADFFQKRMGMYRLRAKVEIERLEESHRVGWSAGGPQGVIAHADPRAEGLGYRAIAPVSQSVGWDEGDGHLRARVESGVCEMGWEFAPDEAFPHDIAMDLLGGIDFKKGCYIGQEVVSRMQHRGTARRRPVLVSGLAEAEKGDDISIGGRSIGRIGPPIEGKAIAIVRIDKVSDADAASVNGQPATLALPKWARYGFGAPSGDSGD